MTNIITIAFNKKEVSVVEEEKEQPKYARMTFDQVTDMKTETLTIPISLQELYKPIIEFYPGFKYIKEHIPMRLMNGIKI